MVIINLINLKFIVVKKPLLLYDVSTEHPRIFMFHYEIIYPTPDAFAPALTN